MTKEPETSCERPWHILRPVKGESVPERLLVFQIEPQVRAIDNDLHEHTFRLGAGVCYWLTDGKVTDQETTIFRCQEDWFRWVQSRRTRNRSTWVCSYGLVYGLTLLNCWRTWSASGESVISAVLSDPPSIVLTRTGRYVTRYVDVANYCRDGLRALLRTCGTPTPISSICGFSDTDVIELCRFKTLKVGEYLCQAISLVKSHCLCGWQPTAAGISFATFRHSFNKNPLFIHGHTAATSLERAALFGGRVQTWRSGLVNRQVTIVDANSLYPAVMRDYPHPVKFRSHQWGGTVRELKQALGGYQVVAAVTIGPTPLDLPDRALTSVSWHGAAGPRYLAGAELRQAAAMGCVERVHALARYDAGFPFTEFVDTLFNLKLRLAQETKHGQATFIKQILNGLPGKFAQYGRRWVQAEETPAKGRWATWWGRHPKNGAVVPYRNLGGLSQYCETAGEWRDSFPGLTASITASARIELARARLLAGADKTLYCDTDSLHVIGDGVDRLAASNLLHPSRLGHWKIVTTGGDAHYWGLKHYRVGDKYCCCFLTASAIGVQDGVYRDAARLHFGYMLQTGLPDAVYYRERTVRVREQDSAERMELLSYEDVA